MRSFRETVQQSLTPHPTQRGFTLDEWTRCFQRSPGSDDDLRLHRAGTAIWEALELIRGTKRALASLGDSACEVFLHVGSVNRNYALVNACMNPEGDLLVDAVVGQLTARGAGGLPIDDAIGTVEANVSSLRYVLSEVLRKSRGPARSPASQAAQIDAIIRGQSLAMAYECAELLWQDCLWHHYVVLDDHHTFSYPPNDWEDTRAVGQHRATCLTSQIVTQAIALWPTVPDPVRRAALKEPIVSAVEESGGIQRLRISESPESAGPPRTFLHSLIGEELYWTELLGEPLPAYDGLTVRDLVRVQSLLSSLSETLIARFPSDTGIQKVEELLPFAPSLSVESVIASIAEGFGYEWSRARAALRPFLWSGSHTDDLWLTPFVEATGNSLLPIVAALHSPNLVRSIEHWLTAGGVDLARRGTLFEEHVRILLAERLKDARGFPDSVVHPATSKFTNALGEVEIDLLWRIGTTLLVGEIKCSAYPTTPLEFNRLRQQISEGAEQARGKADWVRENLCQLEAMMDVRESGVSTVHPLVVSNVPFYVGCGEVDVPVTDLPILIRYISGGIELFGGMQGFTPVAGVTARYWRSTEEAEAGLLKYLRDPFPIAWRRSVLTDRAVVFLPHSWGSYTAVRRCVDLDSALDTRVDTPPNVGKEDEG